MSTEQSSPKPASPSGAPRPSTGYSPRPAGATGQGRPPYPSRPGAGGPGGFAGRGRPPLRRSCRVCEERKGHVDWKAVNYLRSFVTDRGKILAGRSKGICAKCQRNLARAIKMARNMALLPTSPL